MFQRYVVRNMRRTSQAYNSVTEGKFAPLWVLDARETMSAVHSHSTDVSEGKNTAQLAANVPLTRNATAGVRRSP